MRSILRAFNLGFVVAIAASFTGCSAPADAQIGRSARPSDFYFSVAMGEIPGHTLMEKFGENPDIDTADGFVTIWDAGGDYAAPTIPRVHDVVSTLAADAGTVLESGTATGGSLTTLEDTGATFIASGVVAGDRIINDTNVTIATVTNVDSETVLTAFVGMIDAGSGLNSTPNASGDSYRIVTDASTGASILHINGLGAAHTKLEEFVVLNGVGVVATAGTYSHIHRMRIFTAGNKEALGTITADSPETVPTTTAQIINGNNQTLMTLFSCPLDKICHIVQWWAAMAKKQTAVSVVRLRGGTLGGTSYVLQTRAIDNGGDSAFNYIYPVPETLPGGADVWIEADTDTNDVGISAGFTLILMDN